MMCSYCGVKPVVDGFHESCTTCTFYCERCDYVTPYERGTSSDALCDDCGVEVGSTPDNPWRRK